MSAARPMRLPGTAPTRTMNEGDEILILREVAKILRVSKAHVCNLINGKVAGLPRLPAMPLGRRKVVRRRALDAWIRAVEEGFDKLAVPETAAGRMAEGAYHA